jgi:hypothetical protein
VIHTETETRVEAVWQRGRVSVDVTADGSVAKVFAKVPCVDTNRPHTRLPSGIGGILWYIEYSGVSIVFLFVCVCVSECVCVCVCVCVCRVFLFLKGCIGGFPRRILQYL